MTGRVAVGQVWEDRDPRMRGRRVRIVRHKPPYVYVELDTSSTCACPRQAQRSRLRIDRLLSGSARFKLVTD